MHTWLQKHYSQYLKSLSEITASLIRYTSEFLGSEYIFFFFLTATKLAQGVDSWSFWATHLDNLIWLTSQATIITEVAASSKPPKWDIFSKTDTRTQNIIPNCLLQNKDSHGIWEKCQLLYQIRKSILLMEDYPEGVSEHDLWFYISR